MESDHWYRDAFDGYYVHLYSHRDREEADRFVAYLTQVVALGGALVLDLACGAGRYMEALSAAGARPVGYDLSAPLLDEAAGGGRERLVRGDMRALPFVAGAFDGVISMFTSFGYFSDIEAELAVLKEVARCLGQAGWFVIDYMNSSVVRRTLEPSSRREAGGFTVVEKRRIDDDGKRVIKEIELYEGRRQLKRYCEAVRLLEAGELSEMLRKVGLMPVRFLGDYSGTEYDTDNSSRMIVFCRRQ